MNFQLPRDTGENLPFECSKNEPKLGFESSGSYEHLYKATTHLFSWKIPTSRKAASPRIPGESQRRHYTNIHFIYGGLSSSQVSLKGNSNADLTDSGCSFAGGSVLHEGGEGVTNDEAKQKQTQSKGPALDQEERTCKMMGRRKRIHKRKSFICNSDPGQTPLFPSKLLTRNAPKTHRALITTT